MGRALRDRFFDKVTTIDPDQCWLWTGSLTRDGYGRISVNHKMVVAHKVGYQLLVGEYDGELDHLCRVRNCVNPAHLEPVTGAVNRQRQSAVRTTCRRNHPLDGVDTRGHRFCRTCRRADVRRYRQKVGA